MKKIILLILFICVFFMIGCDKSESEKEFLDVLSETTSYKVEGVMETYYKDSSKQSRFTVLYKGEDLIKISLTPVNGNDSQLIIKNKEGVYVLIPSLNKNFKIKSDWPNNGSYPYLLESIAKDIANEENPIITEDEKTKTIETKTTLYKNAGVNKQKITFDKETNLPIEVRVLDAQGNLFIKVVFTNIDLNFSIDEKEFTIDDTMSTMRNIVSDEQIERSVRYPLYVPSGCKLKNEHTISDGKEDVLCIMTYDGDSKFTIVQEYVSDKESMALSCESGYIIHVFGIPAILKEESVQAVYNGIEYTVASNELSFGEMISVLSSYMDEGNIEK